MPWTIISLVLAFIFSLACSSFAAEASFMAGRGSTTRLASSWAGTSCSEVATGAVDAVSYGTSPAGDAAGCPCVCKTFRSLSLSGEYGGLAGRRKGAR